MSTDTPTDLEPAELVARVAGAGSPAPERTAAPADPMPALGHRLLVSTLLALPVIVLSLAPDWQFRYWQWIALALAAPVALWGAWPVHRAAARFARRGAVTTDTLVSLGTLAALGWSVYALLFGTAGEPGLTHPFRLTDDPAGTGTIHLEVAAGVIVFVLAGRCLQARAARRAPGATDVAVLATNSEGQPTEVRVPIGRLDVGTRFVVRPDETIAADGVVVEGSSAVDASLRTGAANPVEVRANDPVTGGDVNVGGRLVVRATQAGAQTLMARMVAAAQAGTASVPARQPAVQRLADRAFRVVGPVVIGLAVATLGYWLGAGASPAHAVATAVAVLLVACPAALGLAAPTALLAGTARGARLGILIAGPEVLESTRRVDTVVVDRTGTVTSGVMTVHQVHPTAGVDVDQALRLAGAVEQACEHPIARAVTAAAIAADSELPGVAEFDSLAGLGVCGVIAEVAGDTVTAHAVLVGRPALLAEHDIELPADLLAARESTEAAGHTAVAVAWDGAARAVIAVGDAVNPSSAAAVRGLRALGLTPILLTGDDGAAARVVADQVGLDPGSVLAEVRPENKVDVVRRLQGEGRVVAMVGDGADDAAALAAADLGLAMGTDAPVGAADLTVLRGDLLAVVDALRLARRTWAVIRSNLGWAFAYHVVALPLAAAGLLNPMIAGAAMAVGPVVVVANTRRLRRFTPDRIHHQSVT